MTQYRPAYHTARRRGDKTANIGAGALTSFADKLSGYNLLTGVYSPLGTGNSLYLTIDAYLNNVAYQAFRRNERNGWRL